jgi:hypothetical protein
MRSARNRPSANVGSGLVSAVGSISEPDIRTTHLIGTEVYRKAAECDVSYSWRRFFRLRFVRLCGFPLRDLARHVPIVPTSVRVPVEPMLYIETSFAPEFVT